MHAGYKNQRAEHKLDVKCGKAKIFPTLGAVLDVEIRTTLDKGTACL